MSGTGCALLRSRRYRNKLVGSDAVRRACIAFSLTFAAIGAASAQTQQHVVLRDGQPVGSYRIEFSRAAEGLVVSSELSVDVRAGFLPLFVYRHSAREVWHGDRLTALESETYDNGKRLRVAGHATAGGFRVEGSGGDALAPVDIRPTSFWRPDAVAQSRLLDVETGRIVNVAATLVAEEPSDGQPTLRRYRLSGQLKHDVELGYKGDRWVSARFRMLGSDIEFRRQEPGDSPQVAVVE
jgi:hypothetical protein